MLSILLLTQVASPRIPVGIDIATLGKIRPGYYIAVYDRWALPQVSHLASADRKNFTGHLYVITSSVPSEIKTIVFGNGKRLSFTSGNAKPTKESLGDVLKRLKGDIRYSTKARIDFSLSLPKEIDKLKGFEGTMTYIAKTMIRGSGLTVSVKNGKITRVNQD